MNKELLSLGKELVKEVSYTWGNLEHLSKYLTDEKTLECIGRRVYKNKEIFNDYLYYKYELHEEYAANGEIFEGRWACEWWYDERGDKYQRKTFYELVNVILNKIIDEDKQWYYDEDKDFYLPNEYYYDSIKNCVVCN